LHSKCHVGGFDNDAILSQVCSFRAAVAILEHAQKGIELQEFE
jgi:hypothetical protein